MSVELSIEVLGIERIRFGLDHLMEGTSNLRPFWEKAGEEFYSEETDLFARQPWPPLTPAYAEQKRKKFGDKPILRATDKLYESLTVKGTEANIHRIDDLEAEFGSSVSYGIFHVGTRDPLIEPDEEKFQNLAGEYLQELIRKAGFN